MHAYRTVRTLVASLACLLPATSLALPPTISTMQACLQRGIRDAGLHSTRVMVMSVSSDATGHQYQRGYPQPRFENFILGVLTELGFRPARQDASDDPAALLTHLKPRLLIGGSITSFEPLTHRDSDSVEGGLGFGGGSGLGTVGGSSGKTVSTGHVTATINIMAPAIESTAKVGWYENSASASSTAVFTMGQRNSQKTGSIALGIGGGTARETVDVVDVQVAAMYAMRMALVRAIAQEFKISTPVCDQ